MKQQGYSEKDISDEVSISKNMNTVSWIVWGLTLGVII